MKLSRLPRESSALVDFFAEGLESIGAVCERTWFDRLQLVAEGRAAQLWNTTGALYETELHFPPADSTAARDAAREVFPGCPLTFRLAETLCPAPLPLERAVLAGESARPPAADVAEKLWRAAFPDTARWRLAAPFAAAHHFSLVTLARCEIQAIDQHWSLHRLALSLPDGVADESLATALDFAQLEADSAAGIDWPRPSPARLHEWLRTAFADELAASLAAIRTRQENYLRRELDRIDAYFESYAAELTGRSARSQSGPAKLKAADRLAAAKAEHARRRADQVQRHEIRVLPHLDALLLVAEPAWRATVSVVRQHEPQTLEALFVPRSRRWIAASWPTDFSVVVRSKPDGAVRSKAE